jgi:serine/threonine protein kinase
VSTPDRWKEISALYAAALEHPDAERAAFLMEACAGDEGLRQELTSLLNCHVDAQHLMTVPAMRVMADTLAGETSLAGRQLGPYRIDAPLASGGMGEVYRATDTRLHRAVAVKILPHYLRESLPLRQRFEREAQAVAALRHPHICVLYDVGRSDDIDFLVMELLDGDTLADRLTHGRLPLREALQHAVDIADALVVTHRQGIVHRDLKPGNVMLTESGAKLLDFGLAKLSHAANVDHTAPAVPHPTAEGDIGTSTAGTLRYMTPEQLEGRDVDHRSDIFAFGVLLYEMVTGRKAFDGPDAASLARAIREREPAPLPSDVTTAAPGLDALFRTCLQKDPASRWQDTRAMADGLRQVAGTSTVARRRVHRWQRVALVAVAVVFVVTVTSWRLPPRTVEPTFTFDFEPVQFTSTGDVAGPALSPDGAFVAYVRSGNLWLAQTTNPDSEREIASGRSGAISSPTITPDGKSVDFVQNSHLWRMPIFGGSAAKVLEQVSGSVGYSPDGKQIAFVRTTGNRSAVLIASVDGGDARELVARTEPSGFGLSTGRVTSGPRWAPDGRVLAVPHYRWVSDRGARRSGVVFLDPRTGVVLAEGPDLLYPGLMAAEWLDDASLLLEYAAQSGPPIQFWNLSYPHGVLTRLQNDLIDWIRLSISADRNLLAAQRSEFRSSLWVDGVEAIGLAHAAPVGNSVEWNGDEVIYATSGVGRSNFLARHVPGRSGSQELVSNAHSAFANVQDGSVAFMSSDGRLWKLDRDGRRERLASVSGLGGRPAVFGRTLLMWRSEGTLARVDSAGGEPVTIDGPVPTGPPDISRDGRSMTFSSVDEQGHAIIVVCDMPDCTNRQHHSVPAIARPPAPYFWRNIRFTPTGDVSYLDRGESNIWILPRSGGRPNQVTQFAPDRRITDFAWSYDGRLAVSRFVWTNDVVLFKRKASKQ